MTENELLSKVIAEYFDATKIKEIIELKGGHINSTYLIKMEETEYILQKINHHVFPSPYGMMHNIMEVTDYIRKKLVYNGLDPDRHTLNIQKTTYGQILCIRDDTYWRCMRYIGDAIAYDKAESADIMYEIGCAVGNFQNLLDGFHTRILDEIIPHFHDTLNRYKNLCTVLKFDEHDRAKDCADLIKYVHKNRKQYDLITDAIRTKKIPRRVAHNDTKPSNILIDEKTKKQLCLIDLDTVMRGSVLFDFGDALRIGASTCAEDERDLTKVGVNFEYFRAFVKGFLEYSISYLKQEEIDMLVDGFYLITLECGMRFLTDYIDGDTYFKISYPDHNLVRAKCQITFAKEIDKHRAELRQIIDETLEELRK